MIYDYQEKRYICWKCGQEVDATIKISRQDDCDACGADLRVCKNCRFWDPGHHNECRENISYYIRDREKANFCAAFEFKHTGEDAGQEADAARSKLEDLFKNLK
ncbi:hypothetical protein KKB55_09095 [Myxococcota bacterium]|nr:hypothetical protein [Myxococcota bacterium]MBU1897890.1 hypothetical protein [Myxococcota bacterium]